VLDGNHVVRTSNDVVSTLDYVVHHKNDVVSALDHVVSHENDVVFTSNKIVSGSDNIVTRTIHRARCFDDVVFPPGDHDCGLFDTIS